MANNILLNKTATASSFVMPYAPTKIVDGTAIAFNRWLCNTLPGWITIDAGAAFWVNRWVIKLMGNAGWASNCNMPAYILQTSIDNTNWTTIDSVAGNTVNTTDRTFATISARFFRISVPSGISINPKLASIMEFEVYDAPPPNGLSSLTISSGSLSPAFNNTTFNYTAIVDYDVTSITLTPTATIPNSTITVDGTAVISGTASQAISINGGTPRTIPIVVTTNGVAKSYSVVVSKHTSAYLTNFQVKVGSTFQVFSPPFTRNNLGQYSLTVSGSVTGVVISITTEDPLAAAVVTSNGTVLTKGTSGYSLRFTGNGLYAVIVQVTSTTGDVKSYKLNITKN